MRDVVEPPIRAVVFDLDGTLMDTASEISLALDRTFGALGIPALPKTAVERLIGRGIPSLVARALEQVGAPNIDLNDAVGRFESDYALTVATAAVLYPGVQEGLGLLDRHRVPMSVATNKARWFSERLLDRAGLGGLLSGLVAGDDGLRRKPSGEMLEAACARMGSRPAETLMLGDSSNDVEAARQAGCRIWCVPYGYNEGRAATTLGCDRIVATVDEAARLVVAASEHDRTP